MSVCIPAASAGSHPFSDVTGDFWAEGEIEYLAQKSIVSGYDDGNFRPSEPVKRSQAASMIVDAWGLDTKDRPPADFTDIDENFHAYEIAETVQDEGIITGRDGAFMPNDTLTRGQMAAILNRSFDFSNGQVDFADIDEEHVFYQDIANIAEASVTTGYKEDNTFRPNNDTNRTQFSVFLARTLEESFKEESFKEDSTLNLAGK